MISNWREDLREVVDEIEPKAAKKVKETKGINNKIIINPKLGEAVEEIGGELIEMKEVDDEDKKDDPSIKQKEKQAGVMKKRVLLAKLRAVRSGGGADIMASYQPEIEHSKLGDAKKKKDKERESKLPPHLQGDALGKMKKAFASEAVKGVDTDMRRMAAQDRAAGKDKKLSPSRGKANVAKMYKDIKHFQKLTKEEVISEKSLTAAQRRALPDSDFVFPGKGEGPEGKQTGAYPINDKKRARAALSMAAAYASPEKEAKVKAAVKKKFPDIQQESALTMIGRTKKKVEKKPEKAMDAGAKARRAMKRREHAKYVSGSTENVPDDMREEKSAFDFVKKQIAAKYGKSGYVSKDNPRKPQTDAEKAKVRAHQAKVDKENAAARAKDPSQGRYPKG
jgi:hypothetical protein|tara:strand:+ start:1256 stop:2437 length:1182 start_codon:yes stop_codon:yes gene_type:complete